MPSMAAGAGARSFRDVGKRAVGVVIGLLLVAAGALLWWRGQHAPGAPGRAAVPAPAPAPAPAPPPVPAPAPAPDGPERIAGKVGDLEGQGVAAREGPGAGQ